MKKYSILMRVWRIIKYYSLVLARKKDSPQNIAKGMALGIFVGFLPVIPFQAAMALAVCSIFKSNKIAGIIGTNIFTNIFIAPFVFYVLYLLGTYFTGDAVSYQEFYEIFSNFSLVNIINMGSTLLVDMLIGGIMVGIVFYAPSYYITLYLVVNFRKKKEKIIIGAHNKD